MHHLGDDLAAGKVPFETHLAGGAKDAAHGAANLGGDAEGAASSPSGAPSIVEGHSRGVRGGVSTALRSARRGVAVTHQHSFDGEVIVEAEEGFDGIPIAGGELRDGGEGGELKLLGKFGAQGGGQVGELAGGIVEMLV